MKSTSEIKIGDVWVLSGVKVLNKRWYFKLLSKLIFQKVFGVFKCFLKTIYSKFPNKPVKRVGKIVLEVVVERTDRKIVKSWTMLK